MSVKWPPINPSLPCLWHGGDYNPDQWLHEPAVLEEDVRLMRLAGCNVMSLAIFAWAALEPQEGRYDFAWLDATFERLHRAGIRMILATPSGARPAWMSRRYPEVLRVGADRRRILHGMRHNHCLTSPLYRTKVAAIDRALADRYGRHPALLLWHLSNEYGGECHCELCQEAFRGWLRQRYGGDLDRLNRAWWSSFWSHTYTAWEQIESPAPHGERATHGLALDWRRFVTAQTVDFMRQEIEAVRSASPAVPVTTNLMGTYTGLDYWRLAPHLDVVSWDNYPCWHGVGDIPGGRGRWDRGGSDWRLAADIAFVHDLNRSLKAGRPFLMMESTPSVTNWSSVSKLKRPGMHLLSSLQAVAHGSDSVQYFQWRKGRGGSEKFHGAVVDHEGSEHTRVFADVASVGRSLARLAAVAGSSVPAQAAVVYDWENRWAIDEAQGPRNDGRKGYEETCKEHYRALWKRGIPLDVVNEEASFEGYRLLVAPMLYMVRPGVAQRLEQFVRGGGTLACTYMSGWVDESDLCFTGGFPGPLRKLLGIWAEEIDALYPGERNSVVCEAGNALGLRGPYEARELCELVHLEGARSLASYGQDFYAGRPALTVNAVGSGQAWYMASRNDQRFLDDLYGALARQLGLRGAIPAELPDGVSAALRSDGVSDFVFLMNFAPAPRTLDVGAEAREDMLDGGWVSGAIELAPYGVRVLKGPAAHVDRRGSGR